MSALSSGVRDPQLPTYHFASSFEPTLEMPLMEDPFGVLLSGASPSLFDGSQPLFSMLDVGDAGRAGLGGDGEGDEGTVRVLKESQILLLGAIKGRRDCSHRSASLSAPE